MLVTKPPAEITNNLWMLGTTAYPLFLFRDGADAAIFEGGVGAMGPLLAEQLEALAVGRDVTVSQIIVTHAHPDHVMAVPGLRRMFPQAAVVASAVAAKTLSVEKAVAFFSQIDEAITAYLLRTGNIRDAHRPQPLAEKQIPVDRVVKEGDSLTIGTVAFQVLETPGHSDCSLSFIEPERKILVISDATGYYIPDADTWWPCYFGDYRKYMDSMRRLEELNAEVVCLSHNAAIRGAEDVRAYFQAVTEFTERYHRRIVEAVRGGKPTRELAEQLGAEVYEKSQILPLDFFQKNCAGLIKQSLRHEGIS